ncbi:Hypothetical protein D9617_12g037970 [Elsinoe fawcettii]|nr:Hypothetical protein D9617_12g037970 [Elsinoe fawcettii]
MAPFLVNGNKVVPEDVPSYVPRTAEKTDFILVQTQRPLDPSQKDDIVKTGAQLIEYLGNNTYLCRYEPHDLQPLRDKTYILEVSIYLRELKSTIALKKAIDDENVKQDYVVDCILHQTPNIIAREVAAQIAEAAQVHPNDLEISSNKVRVVMNGERLEALTKLDFINRIEQVYEDAIVNDFARGTLLTAGDGAVNLTSSTYTGAGQIICVADTGFDLGTGTKILPGVEAHPAFKDRIIRVDTPWRGDDGNDTNGHGTHVCASICGSGIYKHVNRGDITIQGTAPGARILVQSLSKPLPSNPKLKKLVLPSEVSRLFESAYNEGIRIHSNSWGKEWSDKIGQYDYEDQATQMDRFVYGEIPPLSLPSNGDVSEPTSAVLAPHHEDFVILIAAANNGDVPGDPARWPSQLGAAAAAKNAITVGACGSSRPNDSRRFVQDAGAKPITGVNDTAVFSSRGPVRPPTSIGGQVGGKGRIKPDIVAPGVAILSAASRALPLGDWLHKKFGESGDKDWIFMSGTSMATPLVAGCVALMREAIEDLYGSKRPSAALIKALLVNGAVNFSGKLGPGFGYDYEQGFGRVVIDSSLAMIRNGTFVDGRSSGSDSTRFDVPGLIQTGSESERRWESGKIAIPAGLGRSRLVVTLTYPDPAGAALQNSMNLIVVSGAEARHGNMGRNGGDTFDNINNVEKVLWDNVPGPTFKVIIEIVNNWDPHSPASFAAAWDLRAMAKL